MSRHGHAIAVKLSFLGFITAVCLKSAGAGEQPFYSGKTIAVVIATAPGETGNLRYTTVLKHLPSFGGMGGFDNLLGQVEPSRLMRYQFFEAETCIIRAGLDWRGKPAQVREACRSP